MQERLTDKECYSIISDWLNNGPVTYYNLVKQTEFAILKKNAKNDNSTKPKTNNIISYFKNLIRKRNA
jgi:hypothetical protein